MKISLWEDSLGGCYMVTNLLEAHAAPICFTEGGNWRSPEIIRLTRITLQKTNCLLTCGMAIVLLWAVVNTATAICAVCNNIHSASIKYYDWFFFNEYYMCYQLATAGTDYYHAWSCFVESYVSVSKVVLRYVFVSRCAVKAYFHGGSQVVRL
jgi:hypothetical protein